MDNKYIIEIKNVSKVFDGKTVVDNLSLKVKKGEFVTLLGPSGCGKTTTLRMIAGFESPTSGQILFNGEDIINTPAHKRSVNTVFQKYALFPHLNVFDNISFGLKLKREEIEVTKNGKTKIKKVKLSKQIISEKVKKALKIVGLSEYEKRDVTSLSGGQQQRVAIARAIVNEPDVLLLDEPLGALDLKMRQEMQEELREMHKKLGITFIYVTHDQEEALTMSDTIIVMREGVICQEGSPTDIYNEPTNMFVANFIGESNIFNGIVVQDKVVKFLNHVFDCVDTGFEKDEPVDVVVRPEDVIIKAPGKGLFDGEVISSFFRGVHYEIAIKANGYDFICHSTKDSKIGDLVGIYIDPFNIQLMKKEAFFNTIKAEFISNKQIFFDNATYDIDPSIMFPNYKYDSENDILANENEEEIILKGKTALLRVDFDNIDLLDHEEDAPLAGNIEFPIYKGNRYEVSIISDSNVRYTAYTPYVWDNNDRVGLKILAENFIFLNFIEE